MNVEALEERLIARVLTEIKPMLERCDTRLQYVSIKDAAEITSLSYSTVYDSVQRCELPASKVGRTWRIAVADLQAWMASKRVSASLPTRSESGELVRRHLPRLVA
jgi:excisionase family DNA binding protein